MAGLLDIKNIGTFKSRCMKEKVTPIRLRWKPNLGFNFNLEDDVDFRTHVKELEIKV